MHCGWIPSEEPGKLNKQRIAVSCKFLFTGVRQKMFNRIQELAKSSKRHQITSLKLDDAPNSFTRTYIPPRVGENLDLVKQSRRIRGLPMDLESNMKKATVVASATPLYSSNVHLRESSSAHFHELSCSPDGWRCAAFVCLLPDSPSFIHYLRIKAPLPCHCIPSRAGSYQGHTGGQGFAALK